MHGSARHALRCGAMAAAALLCACGAPASTPEAALNAWLKTAEAAVEARDRPALMALISPAYTDARGNDRTAVERLVRLHFLRNQALALLVRVDELQVNGGSAATISVTVGAAGTNDGTFGLRADAYRFDLELEADDDEWLLIGARWAAMGGELR